MLLLLIKALGLNIVSMKFHTGSISRKNKMTYTDDSLQHREYTLKPFFREQTIPYVSPINDVCGQHSGKVPLGVNVKNYATTYQLQYVRSVVIFSNIYNV